MLVAIELFLSVHLTWKSTTKSAMARVTAAAGDWDLCLHNCGILLKLTTVHVYGSYCMNLVTGTHAIS